MYTKFSITIPAYKARFLREAIESCLAQTYENFELIIVDDASPEDLESIVNKFIDPRIRYYRNERNCGAIDVVDNWNICLSYCTGDYVICMGDDDKLMPCCLEKYKNLIEKKPGLWVYHTRTEIINQEGEVIRTQETRPEYESALSLLFRRIVTGCNQFIGDFLFDATKLKEQGGYYKLPLAWASDDITVFRAASHSGIANTQHIGFQYRANADSITSCGNSLIKLKDKVIEENWYKENLTPTLIRDDQDSIYYDALLANMSLYFEREREMYIYESLLHKLSSIFSLYSNSNSLKLKKKIILKSFVRVLKAKTL